MGMYCSHCGTKRGPFIKTSRDGDRQYHNCRACNRKRLAAYYKTAKGKNAIKRAIRKSMKKYPERTNARSRLNYHLNAGHIQKPKTCSQCGKRKKLQAHHTDYSKPLEVIWCCVGCHADLDRGVVHTSVVAIKSSVVSCS